MILEPSKTCFGVYDVEDSGILVDAENYYAALYDAASKARRSIAFAGWQFNTKVELLRGARAEEAELPVTFLDFLRALLDRTPELEVFILAWDFNPIYALERELFQKWKFQWRFSDRVHFVTDDVHPLGASHHQKIALVDGALAFVGGMDVCDHRWDGREHRLDDPRRVTSNGKAYHPYHDAQVYLRGAAVDAVVDLFERRWELATDETFELPRADNEFEIEDAIPMGAGKVGLSETRGAVVDRVEECRHIEQRFVRSIERAERLVYIENQYFTSQTIYEALMSRLDTSGETLQVVLVLPREPSALKEVLALGIRQSKLLTTLVETAKKCGHRLGVYYSSPSDKAEDATYIHSKIMVVDDTLLVVGSANTTNRSLGVDSELDVAWDGSEYEARIVEVRRSLLAEHAGVEDLDPAIEGLVDRLDALCDREDTRLYHLPFSDYGPLEGVVDDEDVPNVALDPEAPVIIEAVEALEAGPARTLFGGAYRWMRDIVKPEKDDTPK